MKKISLVLLISLFSSILFAQKIKMSKAELKTKLDSVLAEGNLLYKYEKAAWISNDLAFECPAVKAEYNGFFTYEEQEEIKTIILGDNFQFCIAEYVFDNNFDKPKSEKIEKRELSEKEKDLIDVRKKILKEIVENKYEVTYPDDYNPNIILLPFADKYKLYIIMGTSLKDVIPFGNDYLFIADKNGKVENWQKFHSILIPGYTMIGDRYKVTKLSHSHLRTTPLMTATDICTFMLYAPLYDMDEFSVYSPAIGKHMNYSLKDNQITVKSKP